MISSVVALVCCIGVAAASICCIPPQWEGQTMFLTTIVHAGKATISKGAISMAYDAINHKIGQIEQIEINGAAPEIVAVLMDYNTDTKYIVHNGKCIKTVLNRKLESFGGCIPDNATMVSSNAKFGFASNDANVNVYSLEYPGVQAYIGVTADACVPVSESTRGALQGNYFLENVQYFNISAGISDMKSLQSPPVGCENAPMVNAHYTQGQFAGSAFGKRSFLF